MNNNVVSDKLLYVCVFEQVTLCVIMFLVLVSVSLSVLEHSLIFSILGILTACICLAWK